MIRKYFLPCNNPTIVREIPGYPRNRTSVGVSTLRLVHRTMKHVIQALACWDHTWGVFIPSDQKNLAMAIDGLKWSSVLRCEITADILAQMMHRKYLTYLTLDDVTRYISAAHYCSQIWYQTLSLKGNHFLACRKPCNATADIKLFW